MEFATLVVGILIGNLIFLVIQEAAKRLRDH